MVTALLLAAAALIAPQNKVEAQASVRPIEGAEAGLVHVVIDLDIASGWHVYHPTQDPSMGIPVSARITSGATATGEMVSLSKAKPHMEKIGAEIYVYQWLSGKPQLVIPAKLDSIDAASSVGVTLNYQTCDDKVCLPPATIDLKASFDPANPGASVAALPGATPAQESVAGTPDSEQAEPAPQEGKQVEISGEEIVLRGQFLSATVPQGGTVRLRFEVEVGDGWHIYDSLQDPEVPGVPFATSTAQPGFALDGMLQPQQTPREHIEDFGGGLLYTYLWVEGSAVFEIDVKVSAAPGEYTVPFDMHWMVCDESICLPEGRGVLNLPITVIKGQGGALGSGPSTDWVNRPATIDNGFWNLIWAAMLAGLATILTPCVFPMIPITVSFFTKRAEQGKGTALGNASAYAIGIIITFVGLGIGAAAILGASGANDIASNAWVNLFIGGLFVFLAFSLLGFFDIKPPKFLANFASKTQAEGHHKSGYAPVMLMAVAFSVTAFTCTVAFVGTVLGLAATGEWWYASAAMFAYALVFAMPFFFLALFPNVMQKMPSAGGWMNAVKVSFGYLELIAAWKFLSATDRQWGLEWLTRPVVVVLTIIPLVLWAAYMFGLYMTKGDYGQKPPRSAPRIVVGLFALAFAVYLGMGFPKGPYEHMWMEAYLPPEYYGRALTEAEQELVADLPEGQSLGPLSLVWHEGWESALEEGREKNALVFIDFTGVTCVNCLKMEGQIFPKPEVAALIPQFVRAHLYVDKAPYGEGNTAFQLKTFDLLAQPYYAVMDPHTEEVLTWFNGYDADQALFAKFLQDGMDLGKARGLTVLEVAPPVEETAASEK
jgi:thiol:disulfide interchange protein/DsbC/DsbD-like thiol-disulfide interchange protein